MTWLDARMVTLLEMADDGLDGLEERMEFRQELLAFFGEVRCALVRPAKDARSLPLGQMAKLPSHQA